MPPSVVVVNHVVIDLPLSISKAVKPVPPDNIPFKVTVERLNVAVLFWCSDVCELLIDLLVLQVARTL